MSYIIKEIFLTLQGEGAYAGHKAVFVRFTGCNVWSGHEADRERDAHRGDCARWCDTDFRGTDGPWGGRYEARSLATKVATLWPAVAHNNIQRIVVLTGGEPSLQVDDELVLALHMEGFRIHVETNGSARLPRGIDWVTLSPKPPAKLLLQHADEIKMVLSPDVADLETYRALALIGYVQPMWCADPVERQEHMRRAVAYVMAHPRWRLGLQAHRAWGVP